MGETKVQVSPNWVAPRELLPSLLGREFFYRRAADLVGRRMTLGDLTRTRGRDLP